MADTFTVTVTSQDHHTLQGTCRTEDGTIFPFRSELELMLELARHIGANEDAE